MKKSQVFEAVLIIALICLVSLLFYMIASSPQSAHGWEKQANRSVDYMFVGGDDTLYTLSGNVVSAFSKDGDLHWQLDTPADWKIFNSWEMPYYSTADNGGYGMVFDSYPIVEENNGSMYLLAAYALNWTDIQVASNISEKSIGADIRYMTPDVPYITKPAKVMKISPEGKVLWEYSFNTNLSTWDIGGLVKPEYYTMHKPIAISVHGDRIYVFHDYTVDVLDAGGSRLFSISNASAPAAVDDNGRIYIVHAVHPSQEQFNQSEMGNYSKNSNVWIGNDATMIVSDPTYMLTSGTVEAYSPDGSLLWSSDIGANATRPFIEKDAWPDYNTLPLYADGRLYVPIKDGVVMLDADGRLNGTTHMNDGTYTLFPLMPLDSHGNLYMMKLDPIQQQSYIIMVTPDGQVSRTLNPYDEYAYYDNGRSGLVPAGGKDGIVYAFENIRTGLTGIGASIFNETIASSGFTADTIHAYDIVNSQELWNFTVPKSDMHLVTLNANSAGAAIHGTPPFDTYSDASTAPLNSYSMGEIRVYPGRNVTYLDYYYSIYQSPLVPDRSKCIYVKGIYALDNNGKLLWEKNERLCE